MFNKTHLKANKLVYALPRHSVTNDFTCDTVGFFATCHRSKHITAHDAIVFYSDQGFPSKMLNEFGANSNGIENVIVWHFRDKLVIFH